MMGRFLVALIVASLAITIARKTDLDRASYERWAPRLYTTVWILIDKICHHRREVSFPTVWLWHTELLH